MCGSDLWDAGGGVCGGRLQRRQCRARGFQVRVGHGVLDGLDLLLQRRAERHALLGREHGSRGHLAGDYAAVGEDGVEVVGLLVGYCAAGGFAGGRCEGRRGQRRGRVWGAYAGWGGFSGADVEAQLPRRSRRRGDVGVEGIRRVGGGVGLVCVVEGVAHGGRGCVERVQAERGAFAKDAGLVGVDGELGALRRPRGHYRQRGGHGGRQRR